MSISKIQMVKKKLTELFIATKIANNPPASKDIPVTPMQPEK